MTNSYFSKSNLSSLSSTAREEQRFPIGVFDSGVGGLTVLREIYRKLPQESILYFGVTARLPYGNRSGEEILQFVREIITWMTQQGVKMVIMACNTSSALALEQVQSEFDVPILGLILPGARGAVQKGKRIGIISTPATAKSNAYGKAIQEIKPHIPVWQIGCPEFVPLIEQNRLYDSYTYEVAKKYLTPLMEANIDTLIYGCTHYRHIAHIFKEILPSFVEFVDPAIYVVKAAEKELEAMELKNTLNPFPTRFCVSGSPEQFAKLSQQWLGYKPTVEKVDLSIFSTKFSVT